MIQKILRTAYFLIGISIIGNAVLFMMGESPFNLAKINEQKSIVASSINEIKIESSVGDVFVLPHDGDQISISMKGKTEKKFSDDFSLSVKNNKNKLTIQAIQKKNTKLFSLFSGDYELLIKLPKAEYKRLQVNSDTSDIKMHAIKANNIDLQTNLGDILLEDVTGVVSAKSDVGDININLLHIKKDIFAKSNLGDITIKTKNEPDQLRTDLQNTIGDEKITLPSSKNGSIGTGGPLVFLSSEVGDLALMMSNE
ncbi:DUF4097 family beta strand repeat-containing protein [Fictibacillus phosphorivorans]|uniref:DUF4097 family beta strand repeat-containing protein n=1 Tax=Fictibacillus TaxID=1329200 RepID=UPI0018CF0572|nr:DUF4097 family beta strand repeat-containing protein [Fictibacillus sp. 23RED33]MBH0172636.1 DUF4097 family beta strand repeat protein [Fictibacillus sp. 23RED33]